MLTLESNRLILRSPVLSDAPLIARAAGERAIADTTISIPHPYPSGEAERYLSQQIAKFQDGRCVTFAIESKPDNLFRGLIEIRDIEQEHSQAELSFWLALEPWGKCYMSESVKLAIRYAFGKLELNRLYAYHMARNPASGRVLQKNGFKQEGFLRQRVRKWGVFEDVVLLALLRQDWE